MENQFPWLGGYNPQEDAEQTEEKKSKSGRTRQGREQQEDKK